MIKVKVPGKLYIAGEYAVVEPNHPAILVTLNRFVSVEVERSNQGMISSDLLNQSVKWRYQDYLVLVENNKNISYVIACMDVITFYLLELGIKPHYYHLRIKSELDHNGKKYGLGSSAAVTVAVIEALCCFYNIKVDDILIFKLACVAHLKLKSNGSFGDLAAAAFTGYISYTSFDRSWVLKKLTQPIAKLLEQDWPFLKIVRLKPPSHLRLAIGWTGSPASTTELVDEISTIKEKDIDRYTQFLENSKHCVNRLIEGFNQGDLNVIKEQIRFNRSLLNALSAQIETPLLTKLCEIAERFNGAAKSSGAGGGDCGIALFEHTEPFIPLYHKWTEFGIYPLELKVYTKDKRNV